MASLYVDLPDRVARIDRRQTRYRFDLDTDIPWDRAGEPGPFHGKRLLADLGVDVAGLAADPEAAAAYDWALALATCLEFIELERGIEDFVGAERAALDGVQSVVWLVEEERKHVELFQRLASALRAARPDLVAAFDHAFHGTRGALFDDPARYPDPAARHYAFWLATLIFEDYTIWLHHRLAGDGEAVQAAWLAAHAAHRREEEQHVVTDVAMIGACALDPEARAIWSRMVHLWLARHRDRFFSLEAPERLVRERFPGLRLRSPPPLAETGLGRELLEHRVFRRTRAASPYLATPAPLPPPPTPLFGRVRSFAGKLARRARELTEPAAAIERFDLRAPSSRPPAPAPGGDLLDQVRAIWARILRVEVGPDDSFASLGGDSVQAVQIHAALERHLGRPLGPELLYNCRTPREAAALLAGERRAPVVAAAPEAAPAREPIAIVGAACRFPGAADLDALWPLLAAGRDVFREPPADRWDASLHRDPDVRAPGKTVCARGGFLDDVRGFEPAAFGLAARDAEPMDPQQRLFLEVAADALEALGGVHPSRIGVFAGSGWNEYFAELRRDPSLVRGATALGNLPNMVAARVAQVMGLTGPAITVDAACASSHVAIHLACASLRAGECDAAIAGAAQLNLSPVPFIAFSQSGVLSPSERCRPFAAAADGFVPGEGAGAVVLKRLSRALADGDEILALVRGSAMNNDGGALSGMAPSPRGQVEVLRAAYADAGVDPASVDVVEAHGTGTVIGDAIEAQALAQVVGECRLGSIKGNLGHTLAAAGIASVLKVVLALRHGELPPLVACDPPNPRLPSGLRPIARLEAWSPSPGRPRRAGVTGLGIGGTNCHLVLEEAPASPAPAATRDAALVCLSAPDASRLEEVAAVYATRLSPAEIAAINRRASRFPARRSVVVVAGDELAARVREPAAPSVVTAVPRLVFVFSGPGSQHLGMARPLYDGDPVFRAAIDRCGRILEGHLRRPLVSVLFGDDPAEIDRIEVTQPVVFAVGWALAEWLGSLAVRPDAVMGHSAAEYVAACVAGALTVEEALPLVARRGAAMARTPAGAMAAVFAPEERVRSLCGAELDVAAVNEPAQVVLSGSVAALERALAELGAAGVTCQRLPISCAAHSPLMAGAQKELAPVFADVTPRPPAIPMYSTLTGGRLEAISAGHLLAHLRGKVQLAAAVDTAAREGAGVFLEVGGSAVLAGPMRATLAGRAEVVPLLRRTTAASWEAPLSALGRLVELGVRVDLRRVSPPARGGGGFPYARRPLWLAPNVEPAPTGDELRLEDEPCVRDHVARGRAIAPGARLIELVLKATGAAALRDLVQVRSLSLAEGPRRVRVARRDDGRLAVVSRASSGGDEIEHLLAREAVPAGPETLDLSAIAARCARSMPGAALYDFLASTGLRHGPSMRVVDELHLGDGELLARLEARGPARAFDPALVDGAMQAIGAFAAGAPEGERPTYLGFAIGQVTVRRPLPPSCLAHIELGEPSHELLRARVTLVTSDGMVCAYFDQVGLRRAGDTAAPPPPRRETGAVALIRPDGVDVRALRRRLEDGGRFVAETGIPADPRAWLERIGPVDAVLVAGAPGALAGLRAALPGLEVRDAEEAAAPSPPTVDDGSLRGFLRAELTRSLRRPLDGRDDRVPFARLGVDSLLAVDLVGRLERRLGVALYPTLLFEHRTIDEVAAALGIRDA